MRRIAAEADCSTTVIYTMFGSKEGLAEALYLEGFERVRRRLEAVPPRRDPLEYLQRAGPRLPGGVLWPSPPTTA